MLRKEARKLGLFKKIKDALAKTRDSFRRKMDALFSKGEINDEFYEDLEDILISSDVGVKTSMEISADLADRVHKEKVRTAENAKSLLKTIIAETLETQTLEIKYPAIITIIGVNGVGKTTSVGKLTNLFKSLNKSVMLVAGDTFRAAASAQLDEWANRNSVKIIKHQEGADAAAVVYDAMASARAKRPDVLIVDTAGRLHTKTNLMEELGKIGRVIDRENYGANLYTLIALDATTGQNALSQIKTFDQFVEIDGIILTKLDGTAKGGVVLSIAREYKKPIVFVGTGEKLEDMEFFNPQDFADNLI